ncbi:MAG: hypothetical protein O6948_10485 [Deltaproteobacteria bacterium]|nr:hypothetical protein [Deltaproteobacteria bacterium]
MSNHADVHQIQLLQHGEIISHGCVLYDLAIDNPKQMEVIDFDAPSGGSHAAKGPPENARHCRLAEAGFAKGRSTHHPITFSDNLLDRVVPDGKDGE